jgi:hypothetical protein
MFALYFNDSQGVREFIATLEDLQKALTAARLLSHQDPRDVVVIENRGLGDTIIRAVFRRGQPMDRETEALALLQIVPSDFEIPKEHM